MLPIVKAGAVLLAVVGLAQMTGDLTGNASLRGLGAATGASPAPKVFSAVDGLETYSTRFHLEWTTRDGRDQSLRLTPEVNARLQGPYNRRNIYGAVLAYGPVLVTDDRTRAMFVSVARHALCGDAPILRELGIDPTAMDGRVRIRLEPRPGSQTGALPLPIEAPCEDDAVRSATRRGR
jgi:hypothetical protein